MAGRLISKQLRRMRHDWDRRARENARHYVLTGQQSWSDDEFYQAGEVTMQEDILNDLDNICQGKDPKEMSVLEIGCGAGRVTRAFANFFGSVYAVDISREMVAQARRAVGSFPHAHVFRNNGKDLSVVGYHWWNRFGIGRPATRFRILHDGLSTHPEPRDYRELCARGSPAAAPRRLIQVPGTGFSRCPFTSGRYLGGRVIQRGRRAPNGRALRIRNETPIGRGRSILLAMVL